MDAKEARELTLQFETNPPHYLHVLAIVKEKIIDAAKLGKRSVQNPLAGIRLHTTQEQRRLVWESLQNQGYKVSFDDQGILIEW